MLFSFLFHHFPPSILWQISLRQWYCMLDIKISKIVFVYSHVIFNRYVLLLQGEEKELLGQQLRVQQQLRIRTAATAHIPRHRRRQETPGRLPTSLRGGSVPEVTYRAGTQACRHTGCAARPAPPFAAVRVLGWLSLGVAPSTPHRERKEGGVSRRNHWRSKSRRQKGKGEGRGAGHDWSRSSDIQWRRPKGAQGQPRGQEAGKARHYPTYGPCHISNYLGFLNVSCVLFVS